MTGLCLKQEYAFTAFTVLLGVTSFACWVGSVADVIRSRNAPRREFAVRYETIHTRVRMNIFETIN